MSEQQQPQDRTTRKIDREQLLAILRDCARNGDPEANHSDADEALIDYIDDDEVREIYSSITRWYA